MADWATFAGVTGVVLVLLLVLSHLTQSAFADGDDDSNDSPEPTNRDGASLESEPPLARETNGTESDEPVDVAALLEESDDDPDGAERGDADAPPRRPDDGVDPRSLSTGEILANVALSQGMFALVLIGAALYTEIPASALGIEFSRAYLETGLLVGTAAGIVFYLANEIGAATATRFGFDHDEQLRELLAPETTRGWVVLLVGVLPIIAVFEELLFRAALIGVLSAGFGIDPWLLAVLSSIAFGLGHGMQGSVGVLVTALLGFALAAVFVLTGSLLVVVVAHYLINAFEFVVHEGLELEWAETIGS